MNFDFKEIAENKLIILYFLDKINMHLSNAQITRFILQNNLMNFFLLQQMLDEMVQTDLLKKSFFNEKHLYSITDNGKNTLNCFINHISQHTKTLIDEYIKNNKQTIKKELEISAKYQKINDTEYMVNCKVIENKITLIDLKLNVVSSKQAKTICNKWRTNATAIYKDIINNIIK